MADSKSSLEEVLIKFFDYLNNMLFFEPPKEVTNSHELPESAVRHIDVREA